jgi:hypothetical protein
VTIADTNSQFTPYFIHIFQKLILKQTAMKNFNYFRRILLAIVVTFAVSCSSAELNTGNYSDDLSSETKTAITNEIMILTTDWVNAHNSMNADKATELWDSSSDLMFAENGEFFANRDSINVFLKKFYQTTTSMDVVWKQRVVIPLSENSACMSGYFHAKAKFKSGDSFDINSMFTGVFVRKEKRWVLIHGHESFK